MGYHHSLSRRTVQSVAASASLVPVRDEVPYRGCYRLSTASCVSLLSWDPGLSTQPSRTLLCLRGLCSALGSVDVTPG